MPSAAAIRDAARQRKDSLSVAVLTLAGAAMLAGCAGPSSSAKGTWDGPKPATAYSKVLIVGLSPDINQRCRFEQIMAGRLATTETKAVASCDVTDHKAPLQKSLIEQAVKEGGFDAVLTTKLVARSAKAKDGGSNDTRGNAGYKAVGAGYDDVYGYYGGIYSVPVVYGEYVTAPEAVTVKGAATIESKLWAVVGPTLVYSLETKVKGAETSDEGLALVGQAITKELSAQKLVY